MYLKSTYSIVELKSLTVQRTFLIYNQISNSFFLLKALLKNNCLKKKSTLLNSIQFKFNQIKSKFIFIQLHKSMLLLGLWPN